MQKLMQHLTDRTKAHLIGRHGVDGDNGNIWVPSGGVTDDDPRHWPPPWHQNLIEALRNEGLWVDEPEGHVREGALKLYWQKYCSTGWGVFHSVEVKRKVAQMNRQNAQERCEYQVGVEERGMPPRLNSTTAPELVNGGARNSWGRKTPT